MQEFLDLEGRGRRRPPPRLRVRLRLCGACSSGPGAGDGGGGGVGRVFGGPVRQRRRRLSLLLPPPPVPQGLGGIGARIRRPEERRGRGGLRCLIAKEFPLLRDHQLVQSLELPVRRLLRDHQLPLPVEQRFQAGHQLSQEVLGRRLGVPGRPDQLPQLFVVLRGHLAGAAARGLQVLADVHGYGGLLLDGLELRPRRPIVHLRPLAP
mmetsp:Transcript_49425/g.159512  ORF Transcript_49425/g.159512 Transcript_49425/m.159512 type:complete len:208 (+) Transcript_49425:489-1112(+)